MKSNRNIITDHQILFGYFLKTGRFDCHWRMSSHWTENNNQASGNFSNNEFNEKKRTNKNKITFWTLNDFAGLTQILGICIRVKLYCGKHASASCSVGQGWRFSHLCRQIAFLRRATPSICSTPVWGCAWIILWGCVCVIFESVREYYGVNGHSTQWPKNCPVSVTSSRAASFKMGKKLNNFLWLKNRWM